MRSDADTLPFARLDDVNPLVVRRSGRTPWRTEKYGDTLKRSVVDADNNALFICAPDIAERIVADVNFAECAREINRSDGRQQP